MQVLNHFASQTKYISDLSISWITRRLTKLSHFKSYLNFTVLNSNRLSKVNKRESRKTAILREINSVGKARYTFNSTMGNASLGTSLSKPMYKIPPTWALGSLKKDFDFGCILKA